MYFSNILETDTINNIKYRNNVVTGEIATVNGNNTYDVYISGSDVAYPNIPTTVKEPDFEVGEAVEILIEYGNKEMPIIIGHAKKVTQDFVEDEINVLVTTLDAYSITKTSAYLEGRIEEIEGYENVIRRGFYYGTSTGYGNDTYSTGSFAAGSYNKQITGLTQDTNYHYQAYVYDAYNDVHKGEDKTMKTLSPVTEIIAFLHYSDPTHYLTILDLNGNVLYTGVHSETNFSKAQDPVAVDNSGNIYIAGYSANRIKKVNSNGSTVLSVYHNKPYQIAIRSNGELWSYGYPTVYYTLSKIDPESLETLDSFILDDDHVGMAFDSQGYLYMVNWNDKTIEKWDVDSKTQVAYRALPTGDIADRAIYSSLAVVGSTVYLVQYANDEGDIFTCPTDLSSDFTANNVDEDFPASNDYCCSITASQGSYIIVEGYVNSVKTIVKYTSGLNRVWKITLDSATYPGSQLGIAAYPF